MSTTDYEIKYANFDGPTEEEENLASIRYRRRRAEEAYRSNPMLTSGIRFIGTPRLAKHKGGNINGVRIR